VLDSLSRFALQSRSKQPLVLVRNRLSSTGLPSKLFLAQLDRQQAIPRTDHPASQKQTSILLRNSLKVMSFNLPIKNQIRQPPVFSMQLFFPQGSPIESGSPSPWTSAALSPAPADPSPWSSSTIFLCRELTYPYLETKRLFRNSIFV